MQYLLVQWFGAFLRPFLCWVQETTLFLQLLYKSEFKHDFSEVLKDKYEKIVIPAVDDEVPNYDYVDTNLDRGMSQLWAPLSAGLSFIFVLSLPEWCVEQVQKK